MSNITIRVPEDLKNRWMNTAQSTGARQPKMERHPEIDN